MALGDLFETEPPAEFVANQSIFLIGPRLAGIGGQELAGALAVFLEFKRPDGSMQSANRDGMLIQTIAPKDFTSFWTYTVSQFANHEQRFLYLHAFTSRRMLRVTSNGLL